jgi:hypothetical protein
MRIKGTVFVLLVLSVLLILAGCNPGPGGGGGLLYVIGAVERDDLGSTSAVVMVTQGGVFGTAITDATVKIGTTELTHFMLGMYISLADLGINANDTVTLSVQRGGSTISDSLQMPEQPSISAPAGGQVNEPVNVSWTITSNPDQYAITVEDTYTASGSEYTGYETGSATGHNIAAGTFNTGLATAFIKVTAANESSALTGDAEAGSMFEVGNTAKTLAFDPEP